MKTYRIMDALGKVNDDYILESAPAERKAKRTHLRWMAAAIALIMAMTFFHTAPGAAALEIVKEAAAGLIETLFPPRDIPSNVEGGSEIIHQQAGGQEPQVQEDGTASTPGFAIYYDTERYTMSEENGVTYIRYNIENDLPPCEMVIRHIPDSSPADAAEAVRTEMAEAWSNVSEVHSLEGRDGLVFAFSEGASMDSACGDIYFISDGQGGTFQITARYFLEAAEGHGVRFGQMVQSFEVLEP